MTKPALPRSPQYQKLFIEGLALFIILGLAAYLRLAHVSDNPGWYTDEGMLINIAQNMMHGRLQYMAINQSFLIIMRFPLFTWLLAGLFQIFGVSITVLREFTGSLGVLAVGLTYGMVRHAQGRKGIALALTAALMLTIYPQAILFSRIGFSYSLLAPLLVLCFWGLWQYLDCQKPGWLALAALAIGVGGASDLMAFTLLPTFCLVVYMRRWKDLLWSLPLIVLPDAIYFLWMAVSVPQAFWFDLQYLFSRLGSIPAAAQIPAAFLNFAALPAWDNWVLLAVVGLFLLKPARLRWLAFLFYFLPLVVLGRTVGLVGTAYYYASPLFPFAALGVASLICAGVPIILQEFQKGLGAIFVRWQWLSSRLGGTRFLRLFNMFISTLALFLLVVGPLLFTTGSSLVQVTTTMQTSFDWALVDPLGARKVTTFVNQATITDDLVITSPNIAWLIKAHVADFQISLASRGEDTLHFPPGIPKNRFAYQADYVSAKFVIVDRLWRNWAVKMMPSVQAMLEKVQNWPLVYQDGEYSVYRNPGLVQVH